MSVDTTGYHPYVVILETMRPLLLRSLLGAVVALLPAAILPAQQRNARPVILIVHGRGQLDRDSAQIRREALEALQNATRRVAGDSLIGEDDVRLVWYGDLMNTRSRTSVNTACSDLSAIVGARREAPLNAITFLAGIAGALFDVAANDSRDSNLHDLRALSGDLRYLADTDIRCAAELRVAKAIGGAERDGRPVILVSHSLGALVSWAYLTHAPVRADSSPAIARWITLGSPLGSAELRTLVFGDGSSTLSLPAGVGTWVNVLGLSDPFSSRILDAGSGATSRIWEVDTEGEHSDAHQLTSYLSDAAAVRAIVGGWCAAGGSSGHAADACGRVQSSSNGRTSPRSP